MVLKKITNLKELLVKMESQERKFSEIESEKRKFSEIKQLLLSILKKMKTPEDIEKTIAEIEENEAKMGRNKKKYPNEKFTEYHKPIMWALQLLNIYKEKNELPQDFYTWIKSPSNSTENLVNSEQQRENVGTENLSFQSEEACQTSTQSINIENNERDEKLLSLKTDYEKIKKQIKSKFWYKVKRIFMCCLCSNWESKELKDEKTKYKNAIQKLNNPQEQLNQPSTYVPYQYPTLSQETPALSQGTLAAINDSENSPINTKKNTHSYRTYETPSFLV